MAKSKITHKTKGFPCALCILAALEVQAVLQTQRHNREGEPEEVFCLKI